MLFMSLHDEAVLFTETNDMVSQRVWEALHRQQVQEISDSKEEARESAAETWTRGQGLIAEFQNALWYGLKIGPDPFSEE